MLGDSAECKLRTLTNKPCVDMLPDNPARNGEQPKDYHFPGKVFPPMNSAKLFPANIMKRFVDKLAHALSSLDGLMVNGLHSS
jgi:hypothetical protein